MNENFSESKNRRNNLKTRKHKLKKKNYNILFILILTYISFAFIKFISNENYNYVVIEDGYIQEKNSYSGILYKDENIFYSPVDGIIEYYYLEGEKVKSNALISTVSELENVDEVKEKLKLLKDEFVYSNNLIDKNLAYTEEINTINDKLNSFVNSYITTRRNYNFEYNYTFKDKLNLELIIRNNLFVMYNNKRVKDILTEKKIYSDQLYTSTSDILTDKSGIISYSFDNYEDIDLFNLTYEKYKDLEKLEKDEINLISIQNKIINKGDPIIKTINSSCWSIFTILPESIASNYFVGDNIKIKIITIDEELEGTIIFKEKKDDESFIKISFNNYLNKVIDKRFVSFEITDNIINGYKIPKSSIVEKEFYSVPSKYLYNSNSSIGIMKKELEDEKFIPLTIEYEKAEEIYFEIDTKVLNINDQIISTENTQNNNILQVKKLTGVYIINNGYKKFKIINPLYSNEDYSIIEKNTRYGLKLYDRVLQEGAQQEN